MLADYHVHTAFSDDAEYPMEQVVLDAIELGLDEICFTDHVDYGIKRDWDDPKGITYRQSGENKWMAMANVEYEAYVAEIQRLQRQYRERITLKMGLEFGMQTTTIPKYRRLFARHPWDFILLSVHQIENKELWTQEFQYGRTQQEYQQRYYEEILALVQQYHDYSVLGHVDLIRRYDRKGIYPFEKRRPVLTEILKTVIADGKGIEVNTSGYRYGLQDFMPSADILKLYHQLGGRVITIGSDSHQKQHLGAWIQETKGMLRRLGYREFCTFEQMQPIFHPLEQN